MIEKVDVVIACFLSAVIGCGFCSLAKIGDDAITNPTACTISGIPPDTSFSFTVRPDLNLTVTGGLARSSRSRAQTVR